MSDKIFIHSSKNFKLEYVQFILSNEAIESEVINSKITEAFVREVKEKMTKFPYCSVSWLYFDPGESNTRFIKQLVQNFDFVSVNLLAQTN